MGPPLDLWPLPVGAVTEILPLSRPGHRALAALLLGTEADPRVELATSLGVWLGTVLFMRRPLLAAWTARVSSSASPRATATLVALSTIAIGAASLVGESNIAAWGREPGLVGASLLLTAVALASTFWTPAGDREAPTGPGAILVALVQAAALLPGLSRPAVALASLLWLGVKRQRAFELCFLAILPVDALILLRDAAAAFRSGASGAGSAIAWMVLEIACAALLAGACLRGLSAATERRLLPFFCVYLVPLALATMAWAYARP
jgi:undecaprenyl-diphosphatase